MKTLKDIVKDYLIANKHDGLCCDGCGCGIDDLMPCDDPRSWCCPAHKEIVTDDNWDDWRGDYDIGDAVYVQDNKKGSEG